MDEKDRRDDEFAKKALEEGLVTQEQLDDAKEAQAKMREMDIDKSLADVLVDKKLISPLHVHAIEKDSVVGAGHKIAGFELVRKVGQGAMGSVYLAKQVTMDRLVALKVLPPRLAADSSYVDRFLREARSSAKLSHANVVQGIDAGEESGLYYFAMEYVQGRTCQQMLDKEGPLPEKEAVAIAKQVASALHHAHTHGLVHRDIKPENIIMDEVTGAAKLCDLGLAKSRGEAGATGGGHVAVGTPHYISPEQARGGEDIDARADIYGLGATLYALVTGRTPFDGPPTVVLSKHLSEQCPAPRDLNHKISPGLDAVIRKMMAKHRTHRYLNSKDLLSDLERLEMDRTPLAKRFEAESTVAFPKPPKRTARKEMAISRRAPAKNAAILAGVAVLMLGLAVAAYFLTGREKPRRAARPGRRPGGSASRPRTPSRGRAGRAAAEPEGDLILCNEYVQGAWLTPDHPEKNYSGVEQAHLQSSTPDRYLVRFDLSEVPKEATLARALFILPLEEREGEGKAFVHRVLKDWDPKTVTYKAPWKEPGMTPGEDLSKEPVAGLLPAGEGKYEADLTLLVEDWLSGGENFGVVLLAEPKKDLHCRYETPEAAPGKGPALLVTFAAPEEEEERPPGQLALERARARARKLTSEKKFAEAIEALDRIPRELRDPVVESKLKFEKGAAVAAALAEFEKLVKAAKEREKKGRAKEARKTLEKALAWKVAAVTRRAKEEMKELDGRGKPQPRPPRPKPDQKAAARRRKEEERKRALERAAALVSQEKFAEAAKLLREKGLENEELCREAELAAAAIEQARLNLPRLVGVEEFKLTRKGIKLTGRVAKASGEEIVLVTRQAGEAAFLLGELSPDDLLTVATYRVIDPKKLLDAHLGCAVLALRGGNASRARSMLLKAKRVAPSGEADRLMKKVEETLSGAWKKRAAELVAEIDRAHAAKDWRGLLLQYRDLKSSYEETEAFKARAQSIEAMVEEARAAVAPKPSMPVRVAADWRKYVARTIAAANSRSARLKKEVNVLGMMEVHEGLGNCREAYDLGANALKNPRDPYRGACENGQIDLACFRILVAMGAQEEAAKHLAALQEKSKGKEEWLRNEAKGAPKWAEAYPGSVEKLADLEKKRQQFPNESSIQWEICDVLGHPLRQFLRQRGELEVMLRKFAGNAEVRNGECGWRIIERASLFGDYAVVVQLGGPLREKHPEHYAVKQGDCSWLLAEARKELRDYRGALDLYEEVLEDHPGHWSVTYQAVPLRIAECKRVLGIR